jgi:hypothetical protein
MCNVLCVSRKKTSIGKSCFSQVYISIILSLTTLPESSFIFARVLYAQPRAISKRQKGVVSSLLFPEQTPKRTFGEKHPRPTASHVSAPKGSRSSAHLSSSHGAAFPKEQGASLNAGSVRRSRRNSIATTPVCPGQRERGGRGDKSKTPHVGQDRKAEEKTATHEG